MGENNYYNKPKEVQFREAEEQRNHILSIRCSSCHKMVKLKVRLFDFRRWENGELIQRALPYLTAAEREMLISQTCDSCFNQMFLEEEYDE